MRRIFFRRRKDSNIAGVSLLMNIPGVHNLGIDGFEVGHFADCTLHTLDLGVSQRFCATVMVHALTSNVYQLPLPQNAARFQKGSQRMAADIKEFTKLSTWQTHGSLCPNYRKHFHGGNLGQSRSHV